MSLQISIREFRDITIVDLRGRCTIDGESEVLSRRVKTLVSKGTRKLLLDLTNLSKIDSTGVSVIVETYVALRAKGGQMKLLGLCGAVLEVFEVLRLANTIPCFEEEVAAVASFQPRGYAATL